MLKTTIAIGSKATRLEKSHFIKYMTAAYCKFFDEDFENLFIRLEKQYVDLCEIQTYVNVTAKNAGVIHGIEIKDNMISTRGFEKMLKASEHDGIDYATYYNKLEQISALYEIYAIEYNAELLKRRSAEIKKLYNKHRLFISMLKDMGQLSENEKKSALLVNKIYDEEFQYIHAKYNSLVLA